MTLKEEKAEVASETSTAGSKSPTEVVKNEPTKQSTLRFFMTFFGLQVALFLAALDNTIVASSLPRIGSDFNEMSIVSWVATAYILTFDAFQPLFSKFSDIFGRKWILLIGICIFLLGSVLCGAAKSMIMLIVSRAIAGIGGGAIFPMVFIIFSDIVPLEKRGNYQGFINSVFALASVCGPLIGGSLTDKVTWRWNFYINLPIGAIALVVLIFFLKLPTPQDKFSEKLKRVDYAGTLIVLSFSILFLLALNFGGQLFPWKSAAVIVPFVLAGVLIVLLVIVEKKFAKEPTMPPRLFKNRSVVGVLISNWFMGMTFFSAVYYLPVYFQVVRNDSAMWSGIRLIPMQLVLAALSAIVGFTTSKLDSYRPFITIGMALLTLWIALISLFNETTPWSEVYGITVIGGLALGCVFSSTIIALQSSVERKDIAVVTGLGNFTRLLGGALGIAITSAILNSQLTEKLPLMLPPEEAEKVLASSVYIHEGLPPEYLDTVLSIYVESLRLCWYVFIPMAGLGFFATLMIKHHSIRKPEHNQHKLYSSTDKPVVVEVPPESTDQESPSEEVKTEEKQTA